MKFPTSEQVAMCVGAEIQSIRLRDTGLSQEDLGSECEINRTTPSLHERGKRCPTLWTVIKYGLVLGIEPEVLVAATMARLKQKKWVE